MTLEEYLNTCPRCGEKPQLTVHIGRPGYSIGCKCRWFEIYSDDIDVLINSWNELTKEDAEKT